MNKLKAFIRLIKSFDKPSLFALQQLLVNQYFREELDNIREMVDNVKTMEDYNSAESYLKFLRINFRNSLGELGFSKTFVENNIDYNPKLLYCDQMLETKKMFLENEL